jgi:hypothetical protein
MERQLAEFSTGMTLFASLYWTNEGANGGGNLSEHQEGRGDGVLKMEAVISSENSVTTTT